jgi:outer membrane protease
MSESGKITRTVFGTSYKEAQSITIRAEKGNLELSSPKEIVYNGKDGGKKLAKFNSK